MNTKVKIEYGSMKAASIFNHHIMSNSTSLEVSHQVKEIMYDRNILYHFETEDKPLGTLTSKQKMTTRYITKLKEENVP